jgi:anaerobic magnesium-protoporphyrin IX monomethyl ester cyclase
MKMTLITPTPLDLSAFGVRSLSAFLKREGFEVRSVFLPGGVSKYRYRESYSYRYESKVISQLLDLCAGSDLIGFSFMSNYYERALQLTEAIKSKMTTPVIWGGIHPTIMPEASLRYADFVCVGEGEYALFELLSKMKTGGSLWNIRNIWTRKDGQIVRNPLRPLEKDLDRFPFFDFGNEDHFVYDLRTDAIVPMTKELLKLSFLLEPHLDGTFIDSYKRTRNYKTMTTRGCPHACTYCAENTLAGMYKGQKYLRKRSVQHVIEELEGVKTELPFVESIFLFDDTFMIRTTQEIIEFAKAYKERIGLPLHIQASPTTLTEESMEALFDAGLCFVEMGIQSASDAGRKLYNRDVSDERLLRAAGILARYRGRIYPPRYHIILDNPWETRDDVLQTLRLVLKLPRPFCLNKSSLVCFPGTPLFTKAQDEGIIKNEDDLRRQVFNKHFEQQKGSYVNFLMYLAGFSGFPRSILNLLAKKEVAGRFDRESLSGFYTTMYRLGDGAIVVYKGIRSLITGDFGRIGRYLTRAFSRMG